MKLGLIGHPLGHSWSPVIHAFMIHEDYQKWDLQEEELDAFMKRHDFDGINVTIPYKEKVLSFLDWSGVWRSEPAVWGMTSSPVQW